MSFYETHEADDHRTTHIGIKKHPQLNIQKMNISISNTTRLRGKTHKDKGMESRERDGEERERRRKMNGRERKKKE